MTLPIVFFLMFSKFESWNGVGSLLINSTKLPFHCF